MDRSCSKIDPQQFAWALRGMPCLGGAISRDIKQAIIPFLDEIDPAAAEINSVNTVIRSGSKLVGFNTDAVGFRSALVSSLGNSLDNIESVVCYGYGGVTNVVAHVFKSLGKAVYITGRRADMVQKKADELSVRSWSPDIQADMFVNAAPVTDSSLEDVPFFLAALSGCRFAFDHEMPGKYLQEYCELHGVVHIPGTRMYLPQMVAQWSLFLENYTDVSSLSSLLSDCDM